MLDQPIELSVEGIDADPTLRSVADRLVGQLEMWVDAVAGAHRDAAGRRPYARRAARNASTSWRRASATSSSRRSGRAAPTRRSSTRCATRRETFTYGGMVAHVLTFAAVRRTLAIGALETAGVTDLGSGDPMLYVGGHGDRRLDDHPHPTPTPDRVALQGVSG